jgi:V/A-type H+/Na+-transporting ATPase subunit I
MIVKMIKYSFLLYHQEFQSFLENIQRIGVLDITQEKRTLNEEEKALLELQGRYRNAIKALTHRKGEQEQRFDRDGFQVLTRFEEAVKELEATEANLKKLQKHQSDLLPWGNFAPEVIADLEAKGLTLRYFTAPSKKYTPEWEAQFSLSVINEIGGLTYFVWVQDSKEAALGLSANEVKVPALSLALLNEEIDGVVKCKENLIAELNELAQYIDLLTQCKDDISDTFDFKSIFNGTRRDLEGTVVLLTGFVPENTADELDKYLEGQPIIFFADKATEEDRPPIKLKNSNFAKLFEPIGELYVPPIYSEFDLTPFFAPFFMLFFGLCMNDIGYGIVFVVAGFLLRNKPKFAAFRPYILLVQWLGVGTILMGFVSGSIFGTEMKEWEILPENIRHLFLDTNKMMLFAVLIGFVQILFGLVVKAINRARRAGWQSGVSPFGWIFLLLGIGMLFIPVVKPFASYLIYGGIALVVLFAHPHGGIVGRLGLGLVELYEITGFFGDLLSYIRLFALGISGAILGMVVNKIASIMLVSLPIGANYLFFGLVLVLGHGANIALSSLGSFVHPMRLTFVEFYKNSGFTGGGRFYTPFKKSVSTQKK